jgi:hypothetical protein
MSSDTYKLGNTSSSRSNEDSDDLPTYYKRCEQVTCGCCEHFELFLSFGVATTYGNGARVCVPAVLHPTALLRLAANSGLPLLSP